MKLYRIEIREDLGIRFSWLYEHTVGGIVLAPNKFKARLLMRSRTAKEFCNYDKTYTANIWLNPRITKITELDMNVSGVLSTDFHAG